MLEDIIYDVKKLKSKAMYFLARREYGVQELTAKLSKYTEDSDLIDKVIKDLIVNSYLSEQRYVSSLVHSKQKKYGINKIRYILQNKQVDESLISTELDTIESQQQDSCRQIWSKKFKELPQDQNEKNKQIRFLLYRGFAMSVIMQMFKDLK